MKYLIIKSKIYGKHRLIVDNADFVRLQFCTINISKGKHTFYANINGQLVHRIIMNAPPNKQVDHINGNGLYCVKKNLRICDKWGNAKNIRKHYDNKSGFKGVTFHSGRYRSQIMSNRKFYSGGRYDSALEAAQSYNELAIKHHGEFAKLNKFTKAEQKILSSKIKMPRELTIKNTTGYRGVSISKNRGNKNPFVAQITTNGVFRYLGGFSTAQEAAVVYNKAAVKYLGKSAILNQIP